MRWVCLPLFNEVNVDYSGVATMSTEHINPIQWNQATGIARQSCARFFRDGGTPEDAMRAFGVRDGAAQADWVKAVEAIARVLCASSSDRRAA
jgi:hypothetical protein